MQNVIYAPFTSLDGFVADAHGSIDFHTPDDDVHRYINEIESTYSDHIYDDRAHDIMKNWERLSDSDLQDDAVREYAKHWKTVRKTVVTDSSANIDKEIYTVAPRLTPELLTELTSTASGDIVLSSAEHAAIALKHGLLHRIHLGIVPVVLGGGTPLFADMQQTDLTLVNCKEFTSGWVFLCYDVARKQ